MHANSHSLLSSDVWTWPKILNLLLFFFSLFFQRITTQRQAAFVSWPWYFLCRVIACTPRLAPQIISSFLSQQKITRTPTRTSNQQSASIESPRAQCTKSCPCITCSTPSGLRTKNKTRKLSRVYMHWGKSVTHTVIWYLMFRSEQGPHLWVTINSSPPR